MIVNSFSTFFFHGPSLVALPLDFVNFDANLRGNNILLDWETANEQNTSIFEVERSTDNNEFEYINEVKAHNTPSKVHHYTLEDQEVQRGVNYYYRIKQIDLDGQFSYSKIIQANLTSKESIFKIYPNPSNGIINLMSLETNNQHIHLKIYDFKGSLVDELNNVSANQPFDFSHLAIGLYFISIENKNSEPIDVIKFNRI